VSIAQVVETKVEIKCDGPDCPISYNWKQEDVGENADKLPDPVFRFLILAGFVENKHVFCSKYCLLQWLKTYEAPKSPREKRVAEEEAKVVQDAKDREAQRLLEVAENEGMP
jgi:hypothetical protein